MNKEKIEFYKLSHKDYNLRINMTKSARIPTPVDTGNLKNNGIYSMKTPKGFRIVWDKRFAHYIEYVNEGRYAFTSEKIESNKYFVYRGMSYALSHINKIKQGDNSSFKGFGKHHLKYALSDYMNGKNDKKTNKRLFESIMQAGQRLPKWNYSNAEESDVVEYDET